MINYGESVGVAKNNIFESLERESNKEFTVKGYLDYSNFFDILVILGDVTTTIR